jgi:superfamily II DNA helicase RecQ
MRNLTFLYNLTSRFFKQSVFRQNLSLHVIPCETGTVQQLVLHRLLKRHINVPIIIYCATRRKTEETASMLTAKGLSAAAYHAGLEKHHRQRIQQDYLENRIHIICATTAFGMGVDKPDIRAVIHVNIPSSLEGYYQEIGRAGRDGQRSWCYLLAQPSDISLQQDIIDRSYPPTNCCTLLLQFFKEHVRQRFTFRELIHFLLPVEEDRQLWSTLKRGEDQGWWTVQWQERWVKLSLPLKDIWLRWRHLTHQHAVQLSKLNAMHEYIAGPACRQQQLIKYFEDAPARSSCKTCDRCTGECAGQPTVEEKLYYQKLEKVLQTRHFRALFLQQLCIEILATVQPQSVEEVTWIAAFGNGWHHKFANRLWPPDTNRHPQIRVVGSTREYQSPRSPPAS